MQLRSHPTIVSSSTRYIHRSYSPAGFAPADVLKGRFLGGVYSTFNEEPQKPKVLPPTRSTPRHATVIPGAWSSVITRRGRLGVVRILLGLPTLGALAYPKHKTEKQGEYSHDLRMPQYIV